MFLDEIGEMSLNTQAKLLRAIQDKIITRVGATIPTNVDVRIIAATNRNFERLIVTYPGDLIRHVNLNEVEGINEGVNYDSFSGYKLQTAVEQLERQMIKNSLETLGSTRKAALELGVSQPTIVRKAAKYNIPLRKQ